MLFIIVLTSSYIMTTQVCTISADINVLLLGGNGLLGSAVVESLMENKDHQINITLLNRGNWYWDTETIVKPFVNHIQCSREDGFRETCTLLTDDDTFYDVIVDFSAYDPLDIEDILIVLKGRFKKYIYISSDSVYEVCKLNDHGGYSIETDARRPTDEKNREQYNSQDNYGDKKLEGEETLAKYHDHLNYDYIALRLPDVLGPRDNTKRFWKYYMWSKLHRIIGPIHLPKQIKEQQLSFVYSKDVGQLIARLISNRYSSDIWNNAYNLGFKTTINLKEFILILGSFINKGTVKFDESDDAYIHLGFPSVSRGPVNIAKAERLLHWNPTDILEAISESCRFYEKAQYNENYKYILDHVLDTLQVRGEKYRDFLELHYDQISKKEEL